MTATERIACPYHLKLFSFNGNVGDWYMKLIQLEMEIRKKLRFMPGLSLGVDQDVPLNYYRILFIFDKNAPESTTDIFHSDMSPLLKRNLLEEIDVYP